MPADRIELLADGPQARAALLELINGATTSLRLLFYIFDADTVGHEVRAALLAARARGVAVSLIVDGFGAAATSDAFFQPLIDADCKFCRFLPHWGRQYLLRNHQKLVIADNVRAIIGGFNIADSYFDPDRADAWRDLGLFIEGLPVERATRYFDRLRRWTVSQRPTIKRLRRLLRQLTQRQGGLRWIFSGPGPRNAYSRSVRHDLLTARRVDMMMGYFSPPPIMLRRLAATARRAEVRLITAGKSDVIITQLAARHTYRLLRRAGAAIAEYQPRRLHAKLIIIDDIVYIGSANFDMRSLNINCELMLRIEDAAFAATCRAQFEADLAQAALVGDKTWRAQTNSAKRLLWSGAYWFLTSFEMLFARRVTG